MSIDQNVQVVKSFFAAVGAGDREALLALAADDIEWIIPGEGWPLAGTHRGHAGVAALLDLASDTMDTSTQVREIVAQSDRVLVIGVAAGKVKATGQPFADNWVFAITVREGKLASIREYIDTQALAQAASTDTRQGD